MAATVIRTIDISGIDNTPAGLTTDGKHLFLAGDQNDKVYTLDKQGNVISSFNTGAVPRGLCFDGKQFWLIRNHAFATQYLEQLDRAGNVLKTINISGMDRVWEGITTDGQYLYLVYSSGRLVYRLHKTGDFVQNINVAGTDTLPTGITTDGKYLWFCGDQNNNIYQMDKLGNIIKTIDVSGTDTAPRGITTDGKYLWWVGNANNILVQMTKN